jgi:hypothetical protein
MTTKRDPVFKERAHAMVEHGLITREEACEHKRVYLTQNDARHAAKAVSRKTDRMATTYKCEFCQHYHVTKFKHGEEAAA